MVHERPASSSRLFKVFGGFASQWRRRSKGNMANCEDAPACRRRHYACNSSKGYRRGRNMKDRMDEIRSTRAPRLREDQIEILRRYGQKRKTEVGDVLFRAGDTTNDFIVILEGQVEVVDDFAGGARTIGVFLAGRFLGELNMLTDQAMYLTAVVREGGEVLAIPRERLKEVVTEEPNLSDIILKAFLARRAYMIRTGLGLRIIGSRHSVEAARLREIAARNRLPHVWVELEEDPEAAEALLERFGAEPAETPVTVWQGKDVLKNPTIA